MTQEELQGWADLRQEAEETRRLLTQLNRHVLAKQPDERTISILPARINLVPAVSAG